jgi:hypothetical protein
MEERSILAIVPSIIDFLIPYYPPIGRLIKRQYYESVLKVVVLETKKDFNLQRYPPT